MVVGVDVYHNPDKKSPSWCGFVASLNNKFSRWTSATAEQVAGVELADSMKNMMARALESYQQENGVLPDKILIYRDGVGDSRLEITKQHELAQIRSLFGRAVYDGGGYRPKVSMVIVSKRISTRLITAGGRAENPPPGTVVDHTITKKNWDNFYMISQNVNHVRKTLSIKHFILTYNHKHF